MFRLLDLSTAAGCLARLVIGQGCFDGVLMVCCGHECNCQAASSRATSKCLMGWACNSRRLLLSRDDIGIYI